MPVRAPTRASSLKRRTVDVLPLPGKRSGSVTPHSTTSERPTLKSYGNPTLPRLLGLVNATGKPPGHPTVTEARAPGPRSETATKPSGSHTTTLPGPNPAGKPHITLPTHLPTHSMPPTPKATPNKTSGSLTPKSVTSELMNALKSPRSPKPTSQVSRPGTPTSPTLKKPAWGARPVDPAVAARVAARSPTPRQRPGDPPGQVPSPKGGGAHHGVPEKVASFRLPSRAASFKDGNVPCGGLDALAAGVLVAASACDARALSGAHRACPQELASALDDTHLAVGAAAAERWRTAEQVDKERRRATIMAQILKEQKALLLEGSPLDLAARTTSEDEASTEASLFSNDACLASHGIPQWGGESHPMLQNPGGRTQDCAHPHPGHYSKEYQQHALAEPPMFCSSGNHLALPKGETGTTKTRNHTTDLANAQAGDPMSGYKDCGGVLSRQVPRAGCEPHASKDAVPRERRPSRRSRDAAIADMAVKVTRLESLLAAKEAQLRDWGSSGRAWLSDARRLRHAVSSTLDALDATDGEAGYLKQEVEVLRESARRNRQTLARLESQAAERLASPPRCTSPHPLTSPSFHQHAAEDPNTIPATRGTACTACPQVHKPGGTTECTACLARLDAAPHCSACTACPACLNPHNSAGSTQCTARPKLDAAPCGTACTACPACLNLHNSAGSTQCTACPNLNAAACCTTHHPRCKSDSNQRSTACAEVNIDTRQEGVSNPPGASQCPGPPNSMSVAVNHGVLSSFPADVPRKGGPDQAGAAHGPCQATPGPGCGSGEAILQFGHGPWGRPGGPPRHFGEAYSEMPGRLPSQAMWGHGIAENLQHLQDCRVRTEQGAAEMTSGTLHHSHPQHEAGTGLALQHNHLQYETGTGVALNHSRLQHEAGTGVATVSHASHGSYYVSGGISQEAGSAQERPGNQARMSTPQAWSTSAPHGDMNPGQCSNSTLHAAEWGSRGRDVGGPGFDPLRAHTGVHAGFFSQSAWTDMGSSPMPQPRTRGPPVPGPYLSVQPSGPLSEGHAETQTQPFCGRQPGLGVDSVVQAETMTHAFYSRQQGASMEKVPRGPEHGAPSAFCEPVYVGAAHRGSDALRNLAPDRSAEEGIHCIAPTHMTPHGSAREGIHCTAPTRVTPHGSAGEGSHCNAPSHAAHREPMPCKPREGDGSDLYPTLSLDQGLGTLSHPETRPRLQGFGEQDLPMTPPCHPGLSHGTLHPGAPGSPGQGAPHEHVHQDTAGSLGVDKPHEHAHKPFGGFPALPSQHHDPPSRPATVSNASHAESARWGLGSGGLCDASQAGSASCGSTHPLKGMSHASHAHASHESHAGSASCGSTHPLQGLSHGRTGSGYPGNSETHPSPSAKRIGANPGEPPDPNVSQPLRGSVGNTAHVRPDPRDVGPATAPAEVPGHGVRSPKGGSMPLGSAVPDGAAQFSQLQSLNALDFPGDHGPCGSRGSHGSGSATGGAMPATEAVRGDLSDGTACAGEAEKRKRCHRSSQTGDGQDSVDREDRECGEAILQKESGALREAVGEAERQLASLQQDLRRLQAREAAQKQAEGTLTQALHLAQSQLDAAQVQKSKQDLRLSSISAELDKTVVALAEASADRASLTRKLAEIEQQLAGKLGEADGRQEALLRLSARASAAEAGMLEAEAKVASLTVQLATVTKEHQAERAKLEANLKEAREDAQQIQEEARRVAAVAAERLTAIQNELTAEKGQQETRAAEGAAAAIRAAALEAEGAQLKAALAEKDAALQGLAAQVPTLQEEVKAVRLLLEEEQKEAQVLLRQVREQAQSAIASGHEAVRKQATVSHLEARERLVEEQLRRTAEEVVDLRLALQRQREQAASELASARSLSDKNTAEATMLRDRLTETEKALEAETADHRTWRARAEQLSWQICTLEAEQRAAAERSAEWARRAGAAEAAGRPPAMNSAAGPNKAPRYSLTSLAAPPVRARPSPVASPENHRTPKVGAANSTRAPSPMAMASSAITSTSGPVLTSDTPSACFEQGLKPGGNQDSCVAAHVDVHMARKSRGGAKIPVGPDLASRGQPPGRTSPLEQTGKGHNTDVQGMWANPAAAQYGDHASETYPPNTVAPVPARQVLPLPRASLQQPLAAAQQVLCPPVSVSGVSVSPARSYAAIAAEQRAKKSSEGTAPHSSAACTGREPAPSNSPLKEMVQFPGPPAPDPDIRREDHPVPGEGGGKFRGDGNANRPQKGPRGKGGVLLCEDLGFGSDPKHDAMLAGVRGPTSA